MRLTQRLSEAVIRKLKVPSKDGDRHVQVVYWDANLKGFGISVSSTGQKSYVVQRGAMTRRTIEKCDLIPFSEAHDTALAWLRMMGKGIDPRDQEKAAKNGDMTLGEVLNHYIETKKGLRPVTTDGYKWMLEKYLSDWEGKPLASITTDLILNKHKALYETVSHRKKKVAGYTGHTTADGVIRLVRALWNFASDTDLIPNLPTKNPVKVLSKTKGWYRAKPQPRTRSVQDTELPGFWKALNEAPTDEVPPVMALAIKTLLLTGLRIGTLRQLRWDEHVDLKEKVLRISAGLLKGNRVLDLPLSTQLHTLLTDWLKEGKDVSGWVFPSTVAGKHLVDIRPAFTWIAKQTEQTRFSPHDLRRTFANNARRAGLGEYDLKALLHHSHGDDVTSGYLHIDAEQLRQPMQRVTDRIMRQCNPTPVIDLAKRRKAKG